MEAQRAYGDYLASRFGLPEARSHVSRSMRSGELAVTHLVSDLPTPHPSTPAAYDDAFLIGLQIGHSAHEIWFEGRPTSSRHFVPGETCFYDLRREPVAYMPEPYHSMQFYLPQSALTAFAQENGRGAVDDLHYRLGEAVCDPVIERLGQAILPSFGENGGASSLFLDHVLQALCAHVAYRYADIVPRQGPRGLARWQERRSKALMDERLGGKVTLSELAAECGLSVSHFTRAFRLATGMPPHRWLMRRRVERARTLLTRTDLTLSEIAMDCGFADQSHFTRVFSRAVGISPALWRREQ